MILRHARYRMRAVPPPLITAPADDADGPPSLVSVVDADSVVRQRVAVILRGIGAEVSEYSTALEFLRMLPVSMPVFVIAGTRLADLTGLALLQELRGRGLEIPLILLSPEPDIAAAVIAIRAGALDFIEPIDVERMLPAQVTPFLTRYVRRTPPRP